MHNLVTYITEAIILAIMVGMAVASFRNNNCEAVLGWSIAVMIFVVHIVVHVN